MSGKRKEEDERKTVVRRKNELVKERRKSVWSKTGMIKRRKKWNREVNKKLKKKGLNE